MSCLEYVSNYSPSQEIEKFTQELRSDSGKKTRYMLMSLIARYHAYDESLTDREEAIVSDL